MSTYPQDVEFEVIKEGWNEYELSDGGTLRTKLTLGKVITPAGSTIENTQAFNFQTQNMVVVYVPQNMKGTPIGRPLSPQEIQDSIIEDLDYEQTKETVNEYKLSNNVTVKLRFMLTRVAKTDKFNTDGAPIYATQTQIVPQIKLPKGFVKRKRRRTRGKTPIV